MVGLIRGRMWLEGKGCGVERGKGERGRFLAGLTDWYLCLPIVLSRLIYFVTVYYKVAKFCTPYT